MFPDSKKKEGTSDEGERECEPCLGALEEVDDVRAKGEVYGDGKKK